MFSPDPSKESRIPLILGSELILLYDIPVPKVNSEELIYLFPLPFFVPQNPSQYEGSFVKIVWHGQLYRRNKNGTETY